MLIFLLQVLFLGLVVFWAVVLGNYLSARKTSKEHPGTVPISRLRTLRNCLIASSIILGIVLAVFIGFVILLSTAVAYM